MLYGSLIGDVADPSRAVLPGATVTVTNRDTGLQRETTTDGSGAYSFRDLQPGTYELKVALSGFKSYARAGLAVTLNAIARADVQMEVGGQTETVTVTAEKPLLQTERADVSTQLDSAQVTNLPISGNARNFQQLYKLIPGASTPVELHSDAGNPQRSLGTNFNGVSRSNNNTRLDGATVSYPWLPHIMAYVPPAEAVETVNVVTNSFDAEQGMAGGAAVNVSIKSGTNEFHGTGHWFHTNSALRARNYFFVGDRSPQERSRISSAARSADRSRRTSCSSSPTGSARSAGRPRQPSGRCRPMRCAGATSRAPARVIYDPPPATPTARDASRSPATSSPPTASTRPRRRCCS